jgi:L-amino acid N-acyltransferase YncA
MLSQRLDDVSVRAATSGDLPAIAGIYAHYVLHTTATFEEEPPSLSEWRRRLEEIVSRRLPFIVAEAGGEVIGYAYCASWRTRPAYRHTVEDSVYVESEAQGRGIGTLLLRELLDACEAAGRREVIAVIAAGAEAAASVALHRRCGFRDAGRLTAVGFKHESWLDTILMQHSFSEGT